VDPASFNRNNQKLYDGCKARGFAVAAVSRNVFQCVESGYCGTGCPINAKRSMLVTLIPDAIGAGARLLFRCRAERLETGGNAVQAMRGVLLDAGGYAVTGKRVTVRAKRYILAGGAVNSPALLLRSGVDGGGRVGRRTFLHPVVGSTGLYGERIEPFQGAPQSVASHAFARRGPNVGFFLECAPGYPVLAATALAGFGDSHRRTMQDLAHRTMHIGLAIDGFHDEVPGGVVTLRRSGAPVLDYPMVPKLWEALREAQKRLTEIAFASGAKTVTTLHDPPLVMKRESDLEKLDHAPWQPSRVALFSAHQMGGCPMGDDPKTAVVRSDDLRHHTLENLHVIDGSVFPTSLGVNPQESIFALARLMATRIAGAF
jgi:choline dehydrogenase-like flavoprotein